MAYEISGRVCARPCEGLEVPISNGRIALFVQTEDGRRELDGTDRRLDGNGEFEEIQLSEETIQPGQPIVVDVWIENPCGAETKEGQRTQVTLTTFEFAEPGQDREFEWCLNPDQYCQVMEELGCRYVCGQITDCETGTPIPGLEVQVFDADIVQPDPLGTDTTDAQGRYLIYYSRADFEKTPARFAPIELIGGPDLFFKIQQGANTLLDESPSDGRQSDREDAGHCEHIDLCVDFDDGQPLAAAWLRVGRYQIPDTKRLHDFDADGYTQAKKYAFFGTLPLEGSIPVRNVPIAGAGSNPIRYRFKVGPSNVKNGASGTASSFSDVVDDGNDLFSGVHVGTLVYQTKSAFDAIEVHVQPGDLKSSGWVRLDEAIRDAYNDEKADTSTASPLAGLGSYKWSPTGKLAGLDSTELTTESMPPESNTSAGDPVPGSPPVADEEFAIRFELQERVSGTWKNMNGHGRTLNRIVLNNNSEFRKLGVVQLEQDLCQPITTANVDLKYTLYHPHMEGAELEIRRNDQNTWTTLNDSATELSFFNVSSTDSKFDHNYDDSFDISSHVDEECAYLVRLRSRRRLTTGRNSDNWSGELVAFCARDLAEV